MASAVAPVPLPLLTPRDCHEKLCHLLRTDPFRSLSQQRKLLIALSPGLGFCRAPRSGMKFGSQPPSTRNAIMFCVVSALNYIHAVISPPGSNFKVRVFASHRPQGAT